VTPIFPPEADTYVFNLDAHGAKQEDFTARFIEDFNQLARAREVKHLVLDTERVRLPKSFKGPKVEHVRGLGTQVWASSHPRVGMGA
jgi:hypothetical protein